jgi:hypothetical protein
MKEKRLKIKYRGSFPTKTKPRIMYRYAYTEKAAWEKFCRSISEEDIVSLQSVKDIFPFDGERTNYSIEVVI